MERDQLPLLLWFGFKCHAEYWRDYVRRHLFDTNVRNYTDSTWDKVVYDVTVGASSFFYTFTPDAGYQVNIASFTRQNYYAGSYDTGNGSWTLHANSTSGAAIATGTIPVVTDNAIHTMSINAGGSVSQTVVWEIHLTALSEKTAVGRFGFQN